MLYVLNQDIINSSDISDVHYIDTENQSVLKASALNIVSGIGNNKFNPTGNITSQEASKMLYNASLIEQNFTEFKDYFSDELKKINEKTILTHIFEDGRSISDYAQNSINYCYMIGIMQGQNYNLLFRMVRIQKNKLFLQL